MFLTKRYHYPPYDLCEALRAAETASRARLEEKHHLTQEALKTPVNA